MKLLIISDTHQDTKTMEEVIQHHHEVDTIIHCGDSELDFSYFADKPIYVVRGNCDFDLQFPEEQVFKVGDEIVYVTHGHKHRVKSTLMPLSYRAQELNASIVCFGHSHLIGAEINNGILFVNPGSLHMPRGRKEKSYAIVKKHKDGWNVFFYSSEHIFIENIILKF
ncbi:metallophosphoesterase [Psychrobacillus sp. PGGUH221]|uniref:metallophosphoesterase family protein n=1 Tax=Psychrobacillus sp. PGGUH221 TaxID=3020058 RepID=UPI0035C77385